MGIRDELKKVSFGILPSQWGLEPEEERLEAFWNRARTRAKLDPLEAVIGADDMAAFRPPAFSGPDPDAFCQEILAGEEDSMTTPRGEFPEDGPLPRVGELSILLDAAGAPHALLRTREVEIGEAEVTERFEVLYRAGQ